MRARRNPGEEEAWQLLVTDFPWSPPPDSPISIYNANGRRITKATKFQLFEVAVAAVFAHLRPDYEWRVTPNRADAGLDFIGRNEFMRDPGLRIDAAITVGGQCKKQETLKESVTSAISGSITTMIAAHNPTFMVVAFSARVPSKSVKAARRDVEHVMRRHCHIFDRQQIEGLFRANLDVVAGIVRPALEKVPGAADAVISYLQSIPHPAALEAPDVRKPESVPAGKPFELTVELRSPLASAPDTRLWWHPAAIGGDSTRGAVLLGPVEAELPIGAAASHDVVDDPLVRRCRLEFVSYSVGDVDLGKVVFGRDTSTGVDVFQQVELGSIQITQSLHPPFFKAPYERGYAQLEDAYESANAAGSATVAVVGTGGSGKTRLCEAFCLEQQRRGQQRRGTAVVVAQQPATLDDPHRLFVELLLGLTGEDATPGDPALVVLDVVRRYDAGLAVKSEQAIRSVFGSGTVSPTSTINQDLVSVLLVLMLARRRRTALIVHLKDLHWCTTDTLLLLDHVLLQLRQIDKTKRKDSGSGILFLFEGRVHEILRAGDTGWSSEPFEDFIEKVKSRKVTCSDFSREEGREFVRRLFESDSTVDNAADVSLPELQSEVIDQIHRSSGGNPFHSLEHMRMLRERGIIGQNPRTGRHYMIKPGLLDDELPETIFSSIRLRWEYLRSRAPTLALLIWSASLLEDTIEAGLFQQLRRALAPDIAARDVDATDVLWTGDGREPEASFRHEHYFEALRQFDVDAEDRDRIVDAYVAWFSSLHRPGPLDQFRWGRALLARVDRDIAGAGALFRKALRGARLRGDRPLARRIAASLLDLSWTEDVNSPLPPRAFLQTCDEDLRLTWDLVESDRLQAARRLGPLRRRIERRLAAVAGTARATAALRQRQLEADVLYSEILFNDRRPDEAARVARRAVRDIQLIRPDPDDPGGAAWDALEVEALRTYAVSLALSGDIEAAARQSEPVLEIARRSPSAKAMSAVSTHANIVLSRDPLASETLLRECLREAAAAGFDELWPTIRLNLGMALLVRASRATPPEREELLDEALRELTEVFDESFRRAQHPHAGAAALLLGIVSALSGDGKETTWFAQAVTSAARGQQMETLWRSHINLANSLYQRDGEVSPTARDHARAALEILEATLPEQSDQTARFRLVAVPLAHVARLLILAGDEKGRALLTQYPALRACFRDPASGALEATRGGFRHHESLRVGDVDYVLY